jgi:hypothetical protein
VRVTKHCEECRERIPDDDAVMHYHAGTVISLMSSDRRLVEAEIEGLSGTQAHTATEAESTVPS